MYCTCKLLNKENDWCDKSKILSFYDVDLLTWFASNIGCPFSDGGHFLMEFVLKLMFFIKWGEISSGSGCYLVKAVSVSRKGQMLWKIPLILLVVLFNPFLGLLGDLQLIKLGSKTDNYVWKAYWVLLLDLRSFYIPQRLLVGYI